MERHPSDSSVLLHCLSKLDRVEVNIALLQETGIGRIVNSLKKSEQEEVAEKARLLVSKWKDVVAKEDDGEETPGATGNPSKHFRPGRSQRKN
ncbi:Transcription elongation factor B polypeptide 3like, partial [Caligus rogercresseyi]